MTPDAPETPGAPAAAAPDVITLDRIVTDGKMARGIGLRIFRGKEKVYEGKLEALKRFKDDVKSVEQNYECGISISGYNNFQVGDIIEAFEVREKQRKR